MSIGTVIKTFAPPADNRANGGGMNIIQTTSGNIIRFEVAPPDIQPIEPTPTDSDLMIPEKLTPTGISNSIIEREATGGADD